ncbi:proton channel OtopLc isoform X1 [Culex quinquefasciatus]|uniref:proton channel OtopLc isoform X1 n=1 Tax=Culex quinquefasciatus TaxID=7176 RepID=UPI0018E3687F|nr:proton channel OtopLc isoform X1 [Culex quinquefasciatus]
MGGDFEWIIGDQEDATAAATSSCPRRKLERLNTLVEESVSNVNSSQSDIQIVVTQPPRPDASPQKLTPNASFAYRPESRRHTGNSLLSTDEQYDGTSRRPSLFAGLRRPSFNVQKKHLVEFLQRHGSKLSLNKMKDDLKVPEPPIVTEMRNKNRAVAEDHFSTAISALYAKLLIVLGLAFPITDVVSDKSPHHFYHGFYLYLYVVSVVFVCFMYAARFRHRARLSYVLQQYEGQTGLPDMLKPKPVHFGSFYLRVGAIAFGIGSMVYSGLEFGQYFELKLDERCHDVLIALVPTARMALCIVQMQFIFFSNGKFHMDRHRYVARFGLMHMLATNVCEWLYVIIEEAKHEIVHIAHAAAHQSTPAIVPPMATALSNGTGHHHDDHHLVRRSISDLSVSVECHRSNIMGSLVQNAAPFLFPCTIEYSLICAVILFEMWKKLRGSGPGNGSRKCSRKSLTGKSAHLLSIDCSNTQRGMFSGILIIVLTIIVLIMYFVLNKEVPYRRIATMEVTISEIILYSLTGAAVVWAIHRMRDLKFSQKKGDAGISLDCTLLVLAQVGIYIYSMFSIIGTFFSIGSTASATVYSVYAEIFSLIQTSLQTLFIMNAWWRRCKGAQQNRTKPGRELITFLLIANMAMWFINTLIKTNASFRPTLIDFYGPWAWTIITHVSMPMAIFYRFHSTICLFEIWKNTYKVRYDSN